MAATRPREAISALPADLPTPALLIERDRMVANVAAMAQLVAEAGIELRPHFKTSKLLEVVALQLEAGACGMTCATGLEAQRLQEAGVDELIWAYAPVGEERGRLAAELNRTGRVIVAVDSLEAARALGEVATSAGMAVPAVIDVDTGLGRTGVEPAEAHRLARDVDGLDGVDVVGVMTHEGHVGAEADRPGGVERAAAAAATALVEAAEAVRSTVTSADIVSVGSTPAARYSVRVDGVTEARPGTYVLNDGNTVRAGAATWDDCAATIVARVVSRPQPGRAIIDAGTKAMAADAASDGSGFGLVLGHDLAFVRAYEEHGVLEGPGADRLHINELVQVVPNHVCAAMNLWSTVLVLADGQLDEWRTVARR